MPRQHKRDYKAEYARRIEQAKAKGLSRSQARGHPKANERLATERSPERPTYSAQFRPAGPTII